MIEKKLHKHANLYTNQPDVCRCPTASLAPMARAMLHDNDARLRSVPDVLRGFIPLFVSDERQHLSVSCGCVWTADSL